MPIRHPSLPHLGEVIKEDVVKNPKEAVIEEIRVNMTKDRKGRRVEQCPGGEKLVSHETLTGYKRP